MKYPEPPSLSMKVIIVMWVMLALVILLILASCSSFQTVSDSPLEPIVENKIREISSSTTMTPKEKESTIAVLESQKKENKGLRVTVGSKEDEIIDLRSELKSCQTELKNTKQAAGQWYGIRNLALFSLGLLCLFLFLKAYKEKIPFNIPFV